MRLLLAVVALIASAHIAAAQSDQTVCATFTLNIQQGTSPVEWRAVPGKAHTDLQTVLDYAAKHCLEGQTQ